jgi:hypothetical protein
MISWGFFIIFEETNKNYYEYDQRNGIELRTSNETWRHRR